MPTPAITNGEEYFFTTIYSGNGQGQRVGTFLPYTDNGSIDKSCMFDGGDSAYLGKTFSGAGNRKTFTISVWFKRGKVGSQYFITSTGADSSNRFQISLESTDRLNVEAKTSGSTQLHLQTNRTFEDTSKWYHVVVSVDTTDSTSGNRGKLYIDGDRVTSFANETYPSQSADLQWNAGQEHLIGKRTYASTYYDGYLAEFNNNWEKLIKFCDLIADNNVQKYVLNIIKTSMGLCVKYLFDDYHREAYKIFIIDQINLLKTSCYDFKTFK